MRTLLTLRRSWPSVVHWEISGSELLISGRSTGLSITIRQKHGHPNNPAIVRHLCLRLPEAKKAEYDETSQAQKEELPVLRKRFFCALWPGFCNDAYLRFRVKFAEYKTTADFKEGRIQSPRRASEDE